MISIVLADNKIVIQEFCGNPLTYWNFPDDGINQIEKIKKELIDKKCRAEDVELHVKNDKIKIIDFGCVTDIKHDPQNIYLFTLSPRIDWEYEFIRFRRIQYLSGKEITTYNDNNL